VPYTVSTPRRFDFETRLFGLKLKQWAYLSVGVAIAGLIGLGVLIPGLPLGVRILLALVVMAPPAAMAYLKVHGLPLDKAMAAWIHYQRGPHRRVWRKGFSEYLVEEGIAEPEAPAVAVDRGAVLATVVVLLNLMVIAILIVATWYMWHEGAKDLMYWLSRLGR
jgi:small-conductance mechanosensitive channel